MSILPDVPSPSINNHGRRLGYDLGIGERGVSGTGREQGSFGGRGWYKRMDRGTGEV
jgi:hypothetical protein